MKTRITKTHDTIIVSMDGRIDYESQEPFKENLSQIIQQARDTSPKKVIFNLERLEFVGSSGISAFIQTLKDFNDRAEIKPRYCSVGSEFRKIIEAFDAEEEFEFYDTEDRARKSFDH